MEVSIWIRRRAADSRQPRHDLTRIDEVGEADLREDRRVAADRSVEPAASETRGGRSRREQSAFWLASTGAVLFLMVVHGQFSFLVSSPQRWFTAVGWMECGALSLRSLAHASCPLVGGSAGGDISNGIAFVAPGSVLIRATGMGAGAAYMSVAFVFTVVGFLGAYALGRRLGLLPWFSFAAAFVYLSAPSLVGMNGLGSTFWGVALIPASVVAGLTLARQVAHGVTFSRAAAAVTWRATAAAVLWVLSIVFMLLLDGYGFVMSQSVVALFLLWEAMRSPRVQRAWVQVGAFFVTLAAGFLVYRGVIPGTEEWSRSGIDLFRSMGADLATLFIPSDTQWWASSAPWAIDPSVMWGDGTNSRYNYLGIVLVVLAVVALVKNRGRRWTGLLLALAVIAAVLALGPSLKFLEIRGPLEVPVTYASYLMPAEDAVASLPTTWLYENVPGLDSMRATYRWIAVTRLAVVLLAALGAQQLFRAARGPGKKPAVLALCALFAVAVLEVAPDLPARVAAYSDRAQVVAAISEDVVEPMREAIPEGSRVVVAPSVGGHTNQYLANYLAPMLRVSMYNLGGDKAVEVASARWPEDVRLLIESEDSFASLAGTVLRNGEADMVVIPFFDLRWSLTEWPTSERFSEAGRAAAEDAADDPSLSTRTYEYFATVVLAD